MKKYQAHATIDYAGFWIRLLAFLIDGIILFAIIWVFQRLLELGFGLGWMDRSVDPLVPDVAVSGAYWVLGLLITLFVIIVYLAGFWRWRGQTPGKMVMRVKITRIDGSNIGWGAVIVRLLGYVPSSLLVGIGFFWIGFDIHRQGLHDKIADTYVISLPRK